MNKFALVSDFDGTISDDDFFYYITAKYLSKKALAPWEEYLAGKKTHFNALKEIFAKLRVKESDLVDFILQIRWDKGFEKAVKLCHVRGMPVYITSAGCDYYIRLLIGELMNDYNITLVTNYSFYSEEMGLEMVKPARDYKYYDENNGVDKAKVVEELQEKGYKVIYCGDGIPDVGAAKIADVVFAKKTLLERCNEACIHTKPFDSFEDVCRFIEENA